MVPGMLSNSLLGGANTERSKGISASPSMLPKCTPILTSQLLWNCVNEFHGEQERVTFHGELEILLMIEVSVDLKLSTL